MINRRVRDSQRSRVYKSDAALYPLSARFEDVPSMQKFVNHIWSLCRVQEMLPKGRRYGVLVKDGRGRRRAGGTSGSIIMPLWSRKTGIILHELAHTIAIRNDNRGADHGHEYCAIYLKLVLYAMGREAHDALKAAFKANRVRFTPPRKREPLSDEQRSILAARLTDARNKKNGWVRTEPLAIAACPKNLWEPKIVVD